MIPALSQVCTLDASFAADVEDYAAGQCHAVEIWLGKLETYLETHSHDDVRRLLDENEMTAPVASFQGGLLTSQGEFRREHWNTFEQRLSLCRALGIGTLILAGDIGGPLTEQDLERVRHSLQESGKTAQQHGVRLAFEFQGRAALANNLQTAASLIADIANPNLGLCLDVFHYYIGPSKPEDLGYLANDNLFHVQFCDLAGQPREFAADTDRILPGDGDFHLAPIVDHLRKIDYSGLVSVELMNPQIWQVPPRQFGEIAITALRKVLGLASMG
jgi:4-hydroxyphenylpyruvate dioxygenase